MARLFDDGSSEYLEVNQAVRTAAPFAMVCKFNTNDMDTHQCLMFLGKAGVDDNCFYLVLNTIADKIQVTSRTSGGTTSFQSLTTYSVDTWHHACGLWVAPDDRRILLDAAGRNTNEVSRTPAGLDVTNIGIQNLSSYALPFSGMIAEAAIYDLSVWPGATDSDKADNFERILPSLTKDFTPKHYPLGRVAYWDLVRGLNDTDGGYNLTASGTVVAAHPRIISPCGAL